MPRRMPSMLARLRLLALILLCLWPAAAHAAEANVCCNAATGQCKNNPHSYGGDKVALLFGVGAYSGKLSPLTNPVKDAEDLAKILKANGFSVRCLGNPKRKEALAELKALAAYVFQRDVADELLLENTRAIVYFAGHGFQLDSADYFFFASSSQLTTKAQIHEVALSRREIFDEFAGLEKFEPHYIFDSCRQFFNFQLADAPGVALRGDFHNRNVENPNPRNAVGGHLVVHATASNGVALDVAPNNPNNGAFMNGFKQQVGFPNLELRSAMQFTVRDLQLQGIAAVPRQEVAGQVSQDRLSISRAKSECEEHAANLWEQTLHCHRLDKACTLPNTCRYLRGRNAADLACLTPMLQARLGYDPLTECAQVDANLGGGAGGSLFTRTQVQEFRSDALEATRSFTARVASVRSTATLNTTALNTDLSRAVTSSPQRPVPSDVQTKIREALLPPKATVRSEFPAMVFDKNVTLQKIPGGGSDIVRTLPPKTPLKLDCGNTVCTDHWSAVTAEVDDDTFRGWVPTSQLVPALELRYSGDALYPKKDDVAALKLKLKGYPRTSTQPLRLTAVQPKGSTLLAESRLIRLKNYVADLGVPADKIDLVIKEVDNPASASFVELNMAPSITNLPFVYQPPR